MSTTCTFTGKKTPRMYEGVKIHSNAIHEDDFQRVYLQLQESTPDGRTLLHDAFQVGEV